MPHDGVLTQPRYSRRQLRQEASLTDWTSTRSTSAGARIIDLALVIRWVSSVYSIASRRSSRSS